MAQTARELAAEAFAKGDRIRTPDGCEGTVVDVNVYAAAIVGVDIDGAVRRYSPWLFFELTNLSREA